MRVGGVTIPKLRLDALTDGVFAVAMTLLVIDLRLPEGFQPKDASELLHRLSELGSQVIVYAVSFYVLGIRWFGMVQLAPKGEEVGESYTRWSLVHLLLITFVPFTTMLVGRYLNLAPSIWLYAANTVAFALVALRMNALAHEGDEHQAHAENRLGLMVLIAASLLVVAVSFVAPRWAMLAYLANLVDEPIRWLLRKRNSSAAAQ